MKKYNLINNSLGWLCFVIALVTYWLTLEPTASFWDCPEFISQGYKLEVGHPPGNPIFMLAARFFINFAGGDVTKVALMVNAMSGLLSALTILLLFWTITHLAKKLIVRADNDEPSLVQMLLIFGAGLCGALMYAWSDTFWFSAVEGEVYAFSSFCTALVFWLILKWENRADQPHSDRYLVLIAYVIGISIAVHLLNLLCIPAIVLVIYYKKFANPNAKGSLIALLISFVIVALILYGLVPGFIKMSQQFELFFVNTVGLSYNMGVLIYAIVLVGVFIWGIREMYSQRSAMRIKISFALGVFLSGIPFIGHSTIIFLAITAGLIAWVFMAKRLPVRILNLALLSIFVIFIGYSSYALLLIRSSANPPMNQNEPDNVFSLSSYLNREQYGENPLIYGRTPASTTLYAAAPGGGFRAVTKDGNPRIYKVSKTDEGQKDAYMDMGHELKAVTTPELNMLFPRMWSGDASHQAGYKGWIGIPENMPLGSPVKATIAVNDNGDPVRQEMLPKPTFAQNISYFLTYQLNHMYWRYFMWNFAGRQNDIQGNGEVNHGNWITGIPFIDNARLGDQSLLPYDEGEGNAGHNVFYLLPLLMGIFGLLWQSFLSKKGIEQFWVVFFLFFMTGIAIVLYLNQPPGQPRERDYAFAGSFYAFAIWVGLGVPAVARAITYIIKNIGAKKDADAKTTDSDDADKAPRYTLPAAIVAAVIAVLIPIQVVSQTWDDHDRSGRTAARDFGMNYLNSLDENAIIFTNGDNDTFPLWYAQEVEGVRTDVKVVNQSYLTTDWYANQVKHPSYDAPAIRTLATPADYAYEELLYATFNPDDTVPRSALDALKALYASKGDDRRFPGSKVYIPSQLDAALKAGRISEDDKADAVENIEIDLATINGSNYMMLNSILSLDIVASSAANGWDRPIYFASTVPNEYYVGLTPYMRSTGLAYEITPVLSDKEGKGSRAKTGVNTEKMYRNVTEKFQWGGLDKVTDRSEIYLDETVRRMVSTHRSQLIDLTIALYDEGMQAKEENQAKAADKFKKAVTIITLMDEKLPYAVQPYNVQMGSQIADIYRALGQETGDKKLEEKARQIYRTEIERFAKNIVYYQSLKPWQLESLQNIDQAIYRYLFLDMIKGYRDAGASEDDVRSIPGLDNINFDRLMSVQYQ